ncbi:GlxA family transcriptional regulator [Duganella qianjiadongensis]|uniref:Helix-turn-helix domain-containing protein n=1 Tax=Duganella qianjiadongensis TaxID=2692176 RepID=A0ABW9VNG1_9BURK|nr:helix-turn-helix domain-containing protein [Duganella qianjiadongensis]MYM41037.1 helix-turn-helix domain-containing protein [Duganella qianjiadongensis]
MGTPCSIALILLPGFSLFTLGAVRSVFALANEVEGEPLYRLRQYSADGDSASTQCGLTLAAEALEQLQAEQGGLLLVIAGERPDERLSVAASHHLAQQLQRFGLDNGWTVGASGAGAQLLAQHGLLEGYRAAIDWQIQAEAAKRHPGTVFTTGLFEIDRNRISAGAGAAVTDMLLHWLGKRHGSIFAAEVAVALGLERMRGGDERQPVPASSQPAIGSARLKDALELMAANLAEPLPAEDIAQLVGVSRRQLERLFRQHLDTLPSRYYLELRLKHARRQLKQTTLSILQVGLVCGFTSGSHFSTTYRNYFGYTPREERARHTMPLVETDNAGDDNE